jgi:uncharacterized membrane protein (DUF4010 family)
VSLLDDKTLPHLLDALLSLGIGLMVGLEREHHEVEDDERQEGERQLGVRTFALLALFGWVTAYLATTWPWLPAVSLALVGALGIAVTLRRPAGSRHGLTTEIAALVVFGLTLLVPQARLLAVALAVVTTLLLVSKPWFGELVPRLSRVDFVATIQLLVVLAIVLPLLPAEAHDPWGVLAPRKIGLFVTLILGVDYAGYVVSRILGPRGAGLTGLVGGLVSSTAVTLSMARKAKEQPALVPAGQLATFLAGAVMPIRVMIISFVLNRRLGLAVAPAMVATALVLLLGAWWKWRKVRGATKGAGAEVPLQNPLSLVSALKWGAFMCVILIVTQVAKNYFGDRGLILTAVVAGLADVDAITLAVSGQANLATTLGALAIMVAVASNTTVKAAMAWASGGRAFAVDVTKVFAAALVVGIAVAIAALLL